MRYNSITKLAFANLVFSFYKHANCFYLNAHNEDDNMLIRRLVRRLNNKTVAEQRLPFLPQELWTEIFKLACQDDLRSLLSLRMTIKALQPIIDDISLELMNNYHGETLTEQLLERGQPFSTSAIFFKSMLRDMSRLATIEDLSTNKRSNSINRAEFAWFSKSAKRHFQNLPVISYRTMMQISDEAVDLTPSEMEMKKQFKRMRSCQKNPSALEQLVDYLTSKKRFEALRKCIDKSPASILEDKQIMNVIYNNVACYNVTEFINILDIVPIDLTCEITNWVLTANNLERRYSEAQSFLCAAAVRGNLGLVQYLIDKGADIESAFSRKKYGDGKVEHFTLMERLKENLGDKISGGGNHRHHAQVKAVYEYLCDVSASKKHTAHKGRHK
jgi:hypothetical protein